MSFGVVKYCPHLMAQSSSTEFKNNDPQTISGNYHYQSGYSGYPAVHGGVQTFDIEMGQGSLRGYDLTYEPLQKSETSSLSKKSSFLATNTLTGDESVPASVRSLPGAYKSKRRITSSSSAGDESTTKQIKISDNLL